MQFRRIRIAGFKSFAEPVSVEIHPGLTGIVGPNGCGKSNVVEALRWAMGEQSTRSMRAGEMDDVIFAGTAGRPSRNLAEVTLTLDGTEGAVPPPFHEQAELEIVRRIERGSGSEYRVNGKEVRARDVQTLFADLATGAHASGMVSQGRVGALVTARPEDRRAVLEEAAGITGLHARRHEAELKLRAAETNLARADDLRGQLEVQLGTLKRQARQASRYRNISGAIRQAEAELLAIQRACAAAVRAEAEAALHAARMAVAAATEAATQAATQAAEAAAALPPLRVAESDARTALERHRVAQEQIAAEEERARAALADATRRLSQLGQDLAHAEQLRNDSEAAEARLAAEDTALAEADSGHAAHAAAAELAAAEAAEAVRFAEAEANRTADGAAEANARTQAVARQLAEAEQRWRRLDQQFGEVRTERDRITAQAVDPATLDSACAEQTAAEFALASANDTLAAAEAARAITGPALAAAREQQAAADTALAKLTAEANALAEVLAVKDGERWPPMVDALTVPPGLETALGAALGEELTSAADRDAARHWRELAPFNPAPKLPGRVTPLAALVQSPPALARVLSQTGLVNDDAIGEGLQAGLAPGQVLVSREGAVWRWDGYTIRAGTPTAAAVRLQQRNRLSLLRRDLGAARDAAAAAQQARAAAAEADQAAVAAEQQARADRAGGERHLERARTAHQHLRSRATETAARLAAIDTRIEHLTVERDEADVALAHARDARSALPDLEALREAVVAARTALTVARSADAGARAECETLDREHAVRTARRSAIAAERADWAQRAADAGRRVGELTERRGAAEAEHAVLQAAPGQIAARRAAALDALEAAEAAHRAAADNLAVATHRSADADRNARTAEASLSTAREDAVRAEGVTAQAEQAWTAMQERIAERLGTNPAMPDPPAELSPETEEKARRRLERLLKEREEMGPVNLRADVEAEAVEKQIAGITAERDELTTAIAKLRGSIGHLNREGRERLGAMFEQIDRNFQALFSRMFGGGKAHLALVGSDDPLEAGLEIYAQPPGKKLATLSLLSGGEQALTALSLIFAVFRCNPAPVCVLDEVDAPLDDANVERFCTLLEDMVRETETRFLVVTHHPLTMARMDRLYGVTMQERGVSRLLSVDLARAAELAEPPRLAAE
ncbi:MAG TPA: chromosome segregation protein SMC [Acetobacteraceae bacterium]|nr:chromosome segregation protein SMC [Acetobacteraceae bacterium]